ncbi:hypothetical protein HMPREF0793_1588 [Staphylococcus caprae M23864:W1]|uniref:Uncharacterized protein n=1 Tax=Staphylococcus caprae TaxID=29380 RepID=A0ABN5W525_9STAP|nr:hypothetical protein HMPREF0793_1588 [Staphylococcus caprae M23864:W1]BBD90526.1 hypothetical protein JMUB145_1960 [Staphylococcus caprae]BBD93018.1 hypothetical protein JMUB590_1963 [Staphylococcus caprae]BBD95521.1 hypothetical protein JMUB898_1955 [Staphylococcus caprae]
MTHLKIFYIENEITIAKTKYKRLMSNIGYWIVESSAAFVVYRADLSFVPNE